VVAVFHEDASFGALQLREAARDVCQLVWVIDSTTGESSTSARLLAKSGTVVDLATLTHEDAVSQLRGCGVSGVVAFTDRKQVPAAIFAEHLGLSYRSPRVIDGLTNKAAQRRLLQQAGLPVPQFWQAPASGDREQLLVELKSAVVYPVVVKPQSGSGSRDAFRVGTPSDLADALADMVDEDVIIEEFLDDLTPREQQFAADYVSVETVCAADGYRHLVVTGRFPLAEPFRETGSFMPTHLPPAEIAEMLKIAESAGQALGVDSGFLHTEIKRTPAGPRVIEVNGRIGGGIPQLLQALGGPPLLTWAFMQAAGNEVPDVKFTPDGVAFFLWSQPPTDAHRVVSVTGAELLSDIPGVEATELSRGPGDAVDWHEGSFGYVYAASGKVTDHETLWSTREEILRTVDVEFA